jgi:NADH-quinone oxidoreductase subunit N
MSGLASAWQVPYEDWVRVVRYLAPGIAVFAVLTATFGNLAAYLQTNLKRLLAYSTIAHAGYMMMGLAPLTAEGAAAVLFYLVVYLFMNLGAFAVVAFLRNQTGSEDLNDFRGLIQRSPLMVITLGVFLLSLLGMPPLAGFVAKFQIVRVLLSAGEMYHTNGENGLAYTMYAVLAAAIINTVLSAVYYIKVLKVMALERPADEAVGREPTPLPLPFGPSLYAALLALVVFGVGVFWNPLATASEKGAARFQSPHAQLKPAEGATGSARMGQR